MKKITLTLTALLFSVMALQAQENDKIRNVQEETVTKTTTVKGVSDKTTVTKTVTKKEQIINISDTGSENQNINYSTKNENTLKSSSTEVKINQENQAAIKNVKRNQKEEIKTSKEAEKTKYDADRLKLKEKAAADAKRKKDSIHRKYQKENN